MRTYTRRVGAALAISLFALTACGPKKAEVVDGKDSKETSQEEEKKEEKKTENPKFGQSAEWEDGVKVTVAPGVPFTPSKYSAPKEGAATSFAVTLENGSDKEVKPFTLLHLTAQSGGKESEKIFDSQNDCGMEPSTVLLPGKSVTYNICFALIDPNDVTLEVGTLDFDKKDIYFTN